MADSAAAKLAADIASLSAMETADLRAELDRHLRLTVEHLVYVAAIWRELEKRGQDLSELKKGIGAYVAAIAEGRVLAETVVTFAGEPAALKRAAALPIPEQRVAVETRTAPPPPVRRHTRHNRAEESCRPTLTSILAMVANCSTADAAELCLQLIRVTSDPADVARRLVSEVERIANEKRRST